MASTQQENIKSDRSNNKIQCLASVLYFELNFAIKFDMASATFPCLSNISLLSKLSSFLLSSSILNLVCCSACCSSIHIHSLCISSCLICSSSFLGFISSCFAVTSMLIFLSRQVDNEYHLIPANVLSFCWKTVLPGKCKRKRIHAPMLSNLIKPSID